MFCHIMAFHTHQSKKWPKETLSPLSITTEDGSWDLPYRQPIAFFMKKIRSRDIGDLIQPQALLTLGMF